MKNTILLFFCLIIILVGLVWYLKPAEQAQLMPVEETKSSVIHAATHDVNSLNISQQSIVTGGEQVQSNSQTTEKVSIDTKSDLSIQPIDPETDVGNQILNNN